jgi:hypothetical protein
VGVEVIGVDWSLAATGVCDAMGVRRTLTPPTKDRVDRLVWFFRQAQPSSPTTISCPRSSCSSSRSSPAPPGASRPSTSAGFTA